MPFRHLYGSGVSSAPMRCRIDALLELMPRLGDESTSSGESEVARTAERVLSALAIERVAMRPALAAARLHDEIEAARAGVGNLIALRLRLGGLDRQRGDHFCVHDEIAFRVTGVTKPGKMVLTGFVRVCPRHLATKRDKVNVDGGLSDQSRPGNVRACPGLSG